MKESLVQTLLEDCELVAKEATLPVPVAKMWDAGQYIWNWRHIDEETGFGSEVFLCVFTGEKGSAPRIEAGARVWNVFSRTEQWADAQAFPPWPESAREKLIGVLAERLSTYWEQAQQASRQWEAAPGESALEKLEAMTKRAG
jgi:hypothetical protein